MITRIKYILIMLIAFFSFNNFANGKDDPLKRFRFADEGRYMLSVPFTMINNLIVIELKINSSKELNFILDSGLTTTMLTHLGPEHEIELEFARDVELMGLGRGEPLRAVHSFGNKIHIDGITAENQDIYILAEDYFNLSARFGLPINGIIGYSVFTSFIIEIDYPGKVIHFHDPDKFKITRRHRKYTSLPLEIINTKPYICLEVAYASGKSSELKVLFDTGASLTLWVEPSSIDYFFFPKITQPSFLGYGLNGEIYGETGRLRTIEIGGYTLWDPVISIPDSASLASATGMDFRNGSIGAELIKRFNIIVDYPNQILRIRPNRYFKERFHQNMSGIEIIAPLITLPLYVVENVRYGSPAWEAGVRPGDEISAINGISTIKLQLFDISKILQSRPGRRISLKLIRDGDSIRTSFRLEEFI